jgi:hypothetical protein
MQLENLDLGAFYHLDILAKQTDYTWKVPVDVEKLKLLFLELQVRGSSFLYKSDKFINPGKI